MFSARKVKNKFSCFTACQSFFSEWILLITASKREPCPGMFLNRSDIRLHGFLTDDGFFSTNEAQTRGGSNSVRRRKDTIWSFFHSCLWFKIMGAGTFSAVTCGTAPLKQHCATGYRWSSVAVWRLPSNAEKAMAEQLSRADSIPITLQQWIIYHWKAIYGALIVVLSIWTFRGGTLELSRQAREKVTARRARKKQSKTAVSGFFLSERSYPYNCCV